MTMTFPTEETIAAIATAISAGQGGIAVIRISGPKAFEVGKSIVSSSKKKDLAQSYSALWPRDGYR